MKNITPQNVHLFNESLRHETPQDIISFVLELAQKPIVTTSFGAYSAAILFACVEMKKDIPVIWCDTGYNTKATYLHAQQLSEELNLQLEIFTPRYTTAFLDHTLGRPELGNPNHEKFSEKVKLEPFQRAFKKYQPDVWFTNLRKGKTAHRDKLDILSFSNDGILKVSPFYYYSDAEIITYLELHQLPTEFDYFDPIKALENRECGIHLNN